jgi:hypothetical protein
MDFWKNKKLTFGLLVFVLIIFIILFRKSKSKFNIDLVSTKIDEQPPQKFPNIDKKFGNFPPLEPPTIPEEIGLAMKYPQGSGVGMSKLDSNSFYPTRPGPLLTNYTIPESYGESSLSDPTGQLGSDQGSRIIKIKNTGNQMNYKPIDEAENLLYSSAYSKNTEVPNGLALINGAKNINYNDSFVPEKNLKLQTSPGQGTDLNNCETTYPNVEHYDSFCITDGDIPYGKIVNGKVNPRLVSRWESYTGIYNRKKALDPIDGLLYPSLNVLINN